MEKEKRPYDFYAGLFYYNFQVEGRNQLSNMLLSAKNFAKCFDEKDIGNSLNSISSFPIKYIVDAFPERFRKDQKKRFCYHLSLYSIEHLYFRDGGTINAKLTREYPLNVAKPSSRQFMTLDDIIIIWGLLKDSVSELFTQVANKHNIEFDLNLLPKSNNRGVSDGSDYPAR